MVGDALGPDTVLANWIGWSSEKGCDATIRPDASRFTDGLAFTRAGLGDLTVPVAGIRLVGAGYRHLAAVRPRPFTIE